MAKRGPGSRFPGFEDLACARGDLAADTFLSSVISVVLFYDNCIRKRSFIEPLVDIFILHILVCVILSIKTAKNGRNQVRRQ